MIYLKAARSWTRSLIVGLFVALICLLAGKIARAQSNELIEATGKGDLSRVRALLNDRADVNAKANDGETALMYAAHNGVHLDVVRALLGAKADVNAKANNGETALMYASRYYGHLGMVRALLDANADVNAKANNGETALMYACQYGKVEVVRALLDAKVDVNAKANNGETALIYTSQYGNIEVVHALLGAKADVNARANNGDTALSRASLSGYPEVAQLLKNAGALVTAAPANDATDDEHPKNLVGLWSGYKSNVGILSFRLKADGSSTVTDARYPNVLSQDGSWHIEAGTLFYDMNGEHRSTPYKLDYLSGLSIRVDGVEWTLARDK